MEDVLFLATSVMIFVLIVFVLAFIWWIVSSIAYMKAFRLCGHKNPWAAWVPLYNLVVLAECTGEEEVNIFTPIPMYIFKFWWVAYFILVFIPYINILSLVLSAVCKGYCYNKIFKRLKKSDDSLWTILGCISAFIGLIPVIIFFSSNEDVSNNTDECNGQNNYGSYSN